VAAFGIVINKKKNVQQSLRKPLKSRVFVEQKI